MFPAEPEGTQGAGGNSSNGGSRDHRQGMGCGASSSAADVADVLSSDVAEGVLEVAGAVIVAAALGQEPGGAEGPQTADGAPPAS